MEPRLRGTLEQLHGHLCEFTDSAACSRSARTPAKCSDSLCGALPVHLTIYSSTSEKDSCSDRPLWCAEFVGSGQVLRVEVIAHFADWIAQLLEAIEYASSTQRILVVEQSPSNTDAREIDDMLELSTQRFFRASDLQMLSEWQTLSAEDVVHLDGTAQSADTAAVLSHLQSLRLTRDLADDARSIVQESNAVGDTYTAVYLNGRNRPWSCEPSSKPVIDSVYDSIRGLITDSPCDIQLNGACDAPAYIRHMRQMLHQDANQSDAPVIVLSDQSCLVQLWHEACPTEQHLHDDAGERILGPAQQFVHFGIMAKANRVVVDHHSPFEIMMRDRSNLKDISMHLAN